MVQKIKDLNPNSVYRFVIGDNFKAFDPPDFYKNYASKSKSKDLSETQRMRIYKSKLEYL